VKTVRALAAGVAIMAMFATPARALDVQFVDPDEGGVSHLDIELSRLSVNVGAPLIHLSIRTYDGWRLPYCSQAGCTVFWDLDSRSGRAVDVVALWYTIRRQPICEVYDVHSGDFLGEGTADKFQHNVFCSFPKRWLHRDGKDIRWRDSTQAGRDFDQAPDAGMYSTANE
jgi:hypothetical protein